MGRTTLHQWSSLKLDVPALTSPWARPSHQWSSLTLDVPAFNNMSVFYNMVSPGLSGLCGWYRRPPASQQPAGAYVVLACSGASPGQQHCNHSVTLVGILLNTQVLIFLAGCRETWT